MRRSASSGSTGAVRGATEATTRHTVRRHQEVCSGRPSAKPAWLWSLAALLVGLLLSATAGRIHHDLDRGSEQVRRDIDVFHPQPAGLASLSERVRNSFDPKRILNRGRLIREGA